MTKQLLPNITIREYSYLLILFLVEFSRNAFLITFLPLYTTEVLGWTIATAGVAASAHFLAETLLKSYAGWQFDRLGKPVLLTGLLAGLLSLIMAISYPRPVLLILSSGLLGLGLSPLWISIMTEIAPSGAKDRPSRISLVFVAWLAGMGSGVATINFFISKSYDLAYLIIISFFTAAFIIALLFFQTASKDTDNINTKQISILEAIRRQITNKAVARLLIPGMFMQTLSASILLPVFPVFATNRVGLDHNGYGFLLLIGGVATIVSLLLMGRLANNISLKILLSAGFAVSSGALATLAWAGNKNNAIIFVIVLGLSYGAVLPAWNSLLARAIPQEHQATGWGVFSTMEGLGISIGSAAGGFLAQAINPAGAITASAAILAIMAFFYIVYPVEKFFQTEIVRLP